MVIFPLLFRFSACSLKFCLLMLQTAIAYALNTYTLVKKYITYAVYWRSSFNIVFLEAGMGLL